MTTTISLDFNAAVFGALWLAPGEFAREMRIAAAVQWCAQGIVSQGKAAELANLTRTEFLGELQRRKVPACQATPDELADEIHGDRHWVVNASPLILLRKAEQLGVLGALADQLVGWAKRSLSIRLVLIAGHCAGPSEPQPHF